jgi:large subunit ribosomal protein L29
MKYADIKAKTISELYTMYNDLKKEAFNLRVQRKFNQVSNTARFSELRRDVARLVMRITDVKKAAKK